MQMVCWLYSSLSMDASSCMASSKWRWRLKKEFSSWRKSIEGKGKVWFIQLQSASYGLAMCCVTKRNECWWWNITRVKCLTWSSSCLDRDASRQRADRLHRECCHFFRGDHGVTPTRMCFSRLSPSLYTARTMPTPQYPGVSTRNCSITWCASISSIL